MRKTLMIFSFILIICLCFSGCGEKEEIEDIEVNYEEELTQREKMEQRRLLSNITRISSDFNKVMETKYPEGVIMGIPMEAKIDYSHQSRIFHSLNNGTGCFYLGASTCADCLSTLPLLAEESLAYENTMITYLDVSEIQDEENYKTLLSGLETKGIIGAKEQPGMTAPLVFFLNKGEVIEVNKDVLNLSTNTENEELETTLRRNFGLGFETINENMDIFSY